MEPSIKNIDFDSRFLRFLIYLIEFSGMNVAEKIGAAASRAQATPRKGAFFP